MTAPFGGQQIGAGSPPVIQTPQPDIQGYLALAMEVMARTRQYKLQQAAEAVRQIKPGMSYGSLTPDQQKALRRATGRKDFQPGEIITPHTVESFLTEMGMGAVGGKSTSMQGAPAGTAQTFARPQGTPEAPADALASNLGLTFLAQRATGAARPLSTKTTLTSEAQATEDRSLAGASVAALGRRAVERLNQGAKPEDLTAPELIGFNSVLGFVPSAPIAEQLTAQQRAKVMEYGIKILQNPESSSIATLLQPYGVKVGDVIGAFANGMGQTVVEAMQGMNIERNKNASIQDVVARATANIAEAVGKDIKFASAAEIIRVMNGDPTILNTRKGRAIAQFMAAGFDASLADAALKGDPSAIAIQRMTEIMRIPQIAGNEKALAQVTNMVRGQIADIFVRAQLGPRPDLPSDDQKRWDAAWSKMVQSMGGVFDTRSVLLLFGGRINVPPQGPGGATTGPASMGGQNDLQAMQDFLQRIGAAANPNQAPGSVPSPAPTATPPVPAQGGAAAPKPLNFSTVPDPKQFSDPSLKEAAEVYAHALQSAIFTPAEREGARKRFEEEYNRVYNSPNRNRQ